MDTLLFLLITGALAGLLAGLLGIGGGLIIVPALAYHFGVMGMSSSVLMHMAIGTSLATMCATSLSSGYAHHRRGTVQWTLLRKLTPGLSAGVFLGGLFVKYIDTAVLRNFFAVFELVVAVYLAFGRAPTASGGTLSTPLALSVSFVIGILCAFAGVGGGIMLVPFLTWRGIPIKAAISTSAAAGIVIAITGTIVFVFTGSQSEIALPEQTIGFVYWPAFLIIGAASILFAPLGTALAHALPSEQLRRLFSVFLLVLAVFMFLH